MYNGFVDRAQAICLRMLGLYQFFRWKKEIKPHEKVRNHRMFGLLQVFLDEFDYSSTSPSAKRAANFRLLT